jgi:hypothetical protein
LERAYGPGRIRYIPAARVRHFVPAARVRWKALVLRCVREGLSKGRLYRRYRGSALSSERGYVRRLVAEAVPRLLIGGMAKRDGRSVLAAAAILVSLLVTGAAFVAGTVITGRRPGSGETHGGTRG